DVQRAGRPDPPGAAATAGAATARAAGGAHRDGHARAQPRSGTPADGARAANGAGRVRACASATAFAQRRPQSPPLVGARGGGGRRDRRGGAGERRARATPSTGRRGSGGAAVAARAASVVDFTAGRFVCGPRRAVGRSLDSGVSGDRVATARERGAQTYR